MAKHARPSRARRVVKAAGTASIPAALASLTLASPAHAAVVSPAVASQVPAGVIASQSLLHDPVTTTYTVADGDTLSAIAGTHCGTTADWTGLYKANEQVIGNDPDVILAGEILALNCTQVQLPQQQPVLTGDVVVSTGDSSFQACVISRESGGNPAAVNTSSGAGGLYQFLPSTWASLGFSGLPEDAPVAEQNEAFEKEYALGGTSAWQPSDGCS